MYLYLVRHGQSVGNEKKLFFGVTDYPLTDLGRAQAREVAAKLRQVTFTRCCASDLARAWETAQLCLAGRELAIQPCPGLREQDMGAFEDVSWAQAQASHGDLVERLVRDWRLTTPPGGESPRDMAARVGRCVDEIIAGGEDTLIVAHNGSLTLILRHLGLVGEEEMLTPGWFFDHGAYSAVQVEGGRAQLVCFNR